MPPIHWLDDVSGGFTNASYWSGGVAPGASDDAILDPSGTTPFTVTVSANGTVAGIQTVAGATLFIAAGRFAALTGTDGGANAGTIAVDGGATLIAGGTLNNTGELDLDQTSVGPYLRLTSAGLTLIGGGEVNLENPIDYTGTIPCPTSYSLDRVIGTAGSTLTNVDNTIAGSGSMGQGTMGLINEAAGVIDASLTTDLVLTDLVGDVINAGLIEATGSGGLYLQKDTIDQTSGGVIAADGGIVYLVDADIIGGTLTSAGGGSVYFDNNDSVLHGDVPGGITNAGQLIVSPGGAAATLYGDIINRGVIAVFGPAPTPTAVFIGAGGASLSGGGAVYLYGPGTATEITGVADGATLTNWDNTISGQGEIGAGRLKLVNAAAGVIDADAAAWMAVNTGPQGLANAGLIESSAGGRLEIKDTAIVQTGAGAITAASGIISLDGVDISGGLVSGAGGEVVVRASDLAGVTLSASAGSVHFAAGTNTLDGAASAVTNLSRLILNNAASVTIAGVIDNSGAMEVHASAMATRLIVAVGGATLTGAGKVLLENNLLDEISGASPTATLTNAQTIQGGGAVGEGSMSLVNAGVIDGNQTTALTIDTGATTVVNSGVIEAVGAGHVAIASAVANSGTLVVNGGALIANGAVTGAGRALIANGTMTFAGDFSEDVTFNGKTGALVLAHAQTYGGTISGFSRTGATALDLEDIAFVSGVTAARYSGTRSGGVLVVTDGTHSAAIALSGNYTHSVFNLSGDGHGGTTVVDPTAPASANAGSPARAMIAALAGFGPRAGAPMSAAHADLRTPPTILARPLTRVA